MASAAQWERRIVGQRTKDALAAKRAAGVRLGRPPALATETETLIVNARASGATLQAVADLLNEQRIQTAQGGSRWHPSTVRCVLRRLAA